MKRLGRTLLAVALVLAALATLTGKAVLEARGPYLEALPDHPFCIEAEWALAEDRVADALELAEAGACSSAAERAHARWDAAAALFARCATGAWTGRGDDVTAVGCALASDLVVFGDVRDLTRQGVSWARGDATDPVLIGLSAVGLVATFAPHVDAGGALLKAARRAGALTDALARTTLRLVRAGTWRPLVNMFSNAGRIARRLGPAGGARALRHADDVEEVATLARFVDAAPNPLLGLRWVGKGAVRLGDDAALYGAALAKGPDGLALAAARGGRALLARQPVLVALAKAVHRDPAALAAFAAWLATALVRWATWPVVAAFAAGALLAAAVIAPGRRRGVRQRRPGGAGRLPPPHAGRMA
ncbi:MAG: hypothetical protein ABR510_11745 [Trueperaceae bacterium]